MPTVLDDDWIANATTGTIAEHYAKVQREGATPNQRLVYALTVETLNGFEGRRFGLVLRWLMHAVMITVCAACTWAFFAGSWWLLSWLSPSLADGAVYIVGGLTFWALFELGRDQDEDLSFDAMYHNGRLSHFTLGRVELLFEDMTIATGVFGFAFGLQVAVIQMTSNHAGIASEYRGMFDAVGWTLDNFLRGVTWDVMEIYGLWVSRPVEHSKLSATVFFVARLAMCAAVLYEVYLSWQRRLNSRLLAGIPDNTSEDFEQLDAWFTRLARFNPSWRKRHLDESIFLQIISEYLRGNYTAVRGMSSQFPRLPIAYDLRDLFVDETGRLCIVSQLWEEEPEHEVPLDVVAIEEVAQVTEFLDEPETPTEITEFLDDEEQTETP